MRYIQRLNKDVNKEQWDIYKGKDANKGNEIYTKAKQKCRYIQRQNKDEVNKGKTKM